MSENMLVLNLLDESLITVEEALQLLNALTRKKLPQQATTADERHKLKVDFILERVRDV